MRLSHARNGDGNVGERGLKAAFARKHRAGLLIVGRARGDDEHAHQIGL
jgi:hypothetical protein